MAQTRGAMGTLEKLRTSGAGGPPLATLPCPGQRRCGADRAVAGWRPPATKRDCKADAAALLACLGRMPLCQTKLADLQAFAASLARLAPASRAGRLSSSSPGSAAIAGSTSCMTAPLISSRRTSGLP